MLIVRLFAVLQSPVCFSTACQPVSRLFVSLSVCCFGVACVCAREPCLFICLRLLRLIVNGWLAPKTRFYTFYGAKVLYFFDICKFFADIFKKICTFQLFFVPLRPNSIL